MNKKDQIYKDANVFFLQQKEKEEQVVKLPSGVLYRWIERGSGPVFPTLNSIVYVRYTCKLIDGRVVDSNLDEPLPACFVVRQLIMGWQIALCRMKAGDKMELFVPWEYGYGKKRVDNIPGYSTLIFEIELLKVELR